MIIYLIINRVSGKMYVGQTTNNLKLRWRNHINDAKRLDTYFARAIKKYGKENFSLHTITECKTKNELNEQEAYWIKYFNTKSPSGYNMTTGGDFNPSSSSEVIIKKFKINIEILKKILKMYANKKTTEEIVEIFQVSKHVARQVLNGKYGLYNFVPEEQIIAIKNLREKAYKINKLIRYAPKKEARLKSSIGNLKLDLNTLIKMLNDCLSDLSTREIAKKYNIRVEMIHKFFNGQNKFFYLLEDDNTTKLFKKAKEKREKISNRNNLVIKDKNLIFSVLNDCLTNLSSKEISKKYDINIKILYKIINGEYSYSSILNEAEIKKYEYFSLRAKNKRKELHKIGMGHNKNKKLSPENIKNQTIGRSKLNSENIIDILNEYINKKIPIKELAKNFNVGKTTITRILDCEYGLIKFLPSEERKEIENLYQIINNRRKNCQ